MGCGGSCTSTRPIVGAVSIITYIRRYHVQATRISPDIIWPGCFLGRNYGITTRNFKGLVCVIA